VICPHVANNGDAQCDKLAVVASRTKLTALATAKKAEKLAKFRVWDRVLNGSTLIFEDT